MSKWKRNPIFFKNVRKVSKNTCAQKVRKKLSKQFFKNILCKIK